jgi:hypothetical protein
MTAATTLRPVLWMTFPLVRKAARSLWTAPGLRERYPAYLAVMHGLVRASVPLMEAAADGCAALDEGDPTAGPLTAYLRTHITEEDGHDDWLREDLATLGVRQPDALLGPAMREDIATLAGAQYYWVRHLHPACLLGYIAVLEGCPPDASMVGRLPELTGWPPGAFRTLARHAADDPGHLRDLMHLLDVLPLNAPITAEVARNAAFTAVRASDLLRRLGGVA